MTIESRSNDTPSCGHHSIIFDVITSEKICSECGLVIEERIIDFSNGNTRFFTREERDKRATYGPLMQNHMSSISLSTIIPRSKDRNKNRSFRHNYHNENHIRNFQEACDQTKRISGNLELPRNTKEEAEFLYLNALKKNLIRGHSIVGMAAACILYIGRKNRNNIREEEVAAQLEGQIDDKDPIRHLRKCYSVLVKELKLKSPGAEPLLLIPRYISDLGLDQQVETWTIDFYNKFVAGLNLIGKDPKGIAVASIYKTCCVYNIHILQKEVAKVAGITDATLRNRWKDFEKALSI